MSKEKTVQFAGESAYDAMVNHYSLDIEDESRFEAYCKRQGYKNPRGLTLQLLESLYSAYLTERNQDDNGRTEDAS